MNAYYFLDQQNTMKSSFLVSLVISLFSVALTSAEEGMFPISAIDRLDLSAKGLSLSASEIFNPQETCLVDGICRVNGCTGSFVSPNGLIVTNHHCAYRAIQSASTEDNDWLKDGFFSKTLGEEIPASGYVGTDHRIVQRRFRRCVGRCRSIDERRRSQQSHRETSQRIRKASRDR